MCTYIGWFIETHTHIHSFPSVSRDGLEATTLQHKGIPDHPDHIFLYGSSIK